MKSLVDVRSTVSAQMDNHHVILDKMKKKSVNIASSCLYMCSCLTIDFLITREFEES